MNTLFREAVKSIMIQFLMILVGFITIAKAYDAVYERYHYCEAGHDYNIAWCPPCYEWLFEAGSERVKPAGFDK